MPMCARPVAHVPFSVAGAEHRRDARHDHARRLTGIVHHLRLVMEERQSHSKTEPDRRLGDRHRQRKKPHAQGKKIADIQCPVLGIDEQALRGPRRRACRPRRRRARRRIPSPTRWNPRSMARRSAKKASPLAPPQPSCSRPQPQSAVFEASPSHSNSSALAFLALHRRLLPTSSAAAFARQWARAIAFDHFGLGFWILD